MTDDQLNTAIAVEIFGRRPEHAWLFTVGMWKQGTRVGSLCAATQVLVERVAELGLNVQASPYDGRAYCEEVLEAFRKLKGAE